MAARATPARTWRELRPKRPDAQRSPFAEPAWLLEEERQPSGAIASSLTVFLLGRECPFTCLFCDLWQHTLKVDTPPGALPTQLELALGAATRAKGSGGPAAQILKLYNASNYFDVHAVPPEDDAAILWQAQHFEKVVVECHARLLGPRCLSFAAALAGQLQVAIGFETIAPGVLARLGKGIEVQDLRRAAAFLRRAQIGLRAFVLIGAPFLARKERPEWTRRTCELALEEGAEQVVLIPLRPSPGELQRLVDAGEVELPDLEEVAATVELCAPLAPERILLDTWDLDRWAAASSATTSSATTPGTLAGLLRFAAGDKP